MKRTVIQTTGILALFLLVSCGSGQQPSLQDENAKSSASQNQSETTEDGAGNNAYQNNMTTAGTGTSQRLITDLTGSTMIPVCSGRTGTTGPSGAKGPGGRTGATGMIGSMGGTGTAGRMGTMRGTITTDSSIVQVSIDIMPGGEPNSINPDSQGVTPTAILSSPLFDATDVVDRASLTFGATGDEPSLAFCDGGYEDVNNDGLSDLVCHFTTQLTGFGIGDAEGILKGRTTDDLAFEASDSVRIVPSAE